MEMLNTHFLQSQLFWVTVSFLFLLWCMWKFVIPALNAILDERAERISTDLGQAARLKEEAEKTLADYEKKLREARDEAAGIIATARQEAKDITTSRMAELEAELSRKGEAARKGVEQAKERAMRDVREDVVEIVMAAVERVLAEGMDKKKASDLANKAIEELAH